MTPTPLGVPSSMEGFGDTDPTGCTVIHGGFWGHRPHWLYRHPWRVLVTPTPLAVPSSMEGVGDTDPTGCTVIYGVSTNTLQETSFV